VYSIGFLQSIKEAFKKRSFSDKNKKRKVMEKQVDDPGVPMSPGSRKNRQNCLVT